LALALSSALHLPRHRFRSFWWISSRPDSPLVNLWINCFQLSAEH